MVRQPMLVLAALFAASSLAGAASAGQPTTDSTTKAARDPNERICKDIGPSGSRIIPKRICATRAEWQQRELQDKAQTQLMQRPVQTCGIMGTRRC